MRAKKTDKKEPTNKSWKEIKERVRRLKCNEARSSGNDLLDGFKQNVEKRKSKIKELSISKETDNKSKLFWIFLLFYIFTWFYWF